MRFAEDLQRTAAELEDQAASRTERRRYKYLQECAKELSTAACTPDPVAAVAELDEKYAAEFESGAEHAADAGMLSRACRALAIGEDPVPLPPRS